MESSKPRPLVVIKSPVMIYIYSSGHIRRSRQHSRGSALEQLFEKVRCALLKLKGFLFSYIYVALSTVLKKSITHISIIRGYRCVMVRLQSTNKLPNYRHAEDRFYTHAAYCHRVAPSNVSSTSTATRRPVSHAPSTQAG